MVKYHIDFILAQPSMQPQSQSSAHSCLDAPCNYLHGAELGEVAKVRL